MKHLAVLLSAFAIQVSLAAADPPAKYLDLSSWKLTLPVDTDRTGRPDEVEHPELATFQDPRCFFANSTADGVIFRAHCGGSTSKSSKYPRCELREMTRRRTAGGTVPATWGTDDGRIHSMSAVMAISRTPPVKRHVVCAQIHDADDDVIMVRLEGTKLLIERNSLEDVVLDRDYQLGTPIELKIQSGDGSIKVWHNGALKLDWRVSRAMCYFKAGCYTQSNREQGDAADSFGEVVIYQLKVEHQD
jgi:poly(beta-D-mannuronate) lyase